MAVSPRFASCGRRRMAAELADVARSVIDANSYMALGTADRAGNPWVSPVWFASEDYRNFHWVSSPDAKHSRNLAAHPQVAIAIFDSSVPVGGAQAVYMTGVAKQLTGAELEQGLEVLTACPDRTSVARLDWTMCRDRHCSGSIARRCGSTGCWSRAGIQTVARGSTAASACRSSKPKAEQDPLQQPRMGWHAALVVGAWFSHRAQGGGIWPVGAGMPDPQGQALHQPTRHPSRPRPASTCMADFVGSVACPWRPWGMPRCPPSPGSMGRADRPARQPKGSHHDRGSRELCRQPDRGSRAAAHRGWDRPVHGPGGGVGSAGAGGVVLHGGCAPRGVMGSGRDARALPPVCRSRLVKLGAA